MQYACALMFLRDFWPPEQTGNVLSCDVAFIGHGTSAWGLYDALAFAEEGDEPATQFNLAAMAQIAPAAGDETVAPLSAEEAVPLLAVLSATDNAVADGVAHRQTVLHEVMGWEDGYIEDPPDLELPTKAVIWAHDVEHDAFGGGAVVSESQLMTDADIDPEDNREKGETIAAEYVSAFLTWQLPHGGGIDDLRRYFTGQAYPEAVLDPALWDYLPAYVDLTPTDCESVTTEPECTDPELSPGCHWRPTAEDCVRRPVIKHGFTVPQEYRREIDVLDRPSATTGLDYAVPWGTFLDTSFVIGNEVELADVSDRFAASPLPAQLTSTLRARWGDPQVPTQAVSGYVRWPLGEVDLFAYSYLSLRVGIVSDSVGSATQCSPASDEPLSLDVTLWRNTPEGLEPRTVTVAVTQQEIQSVEGESGPFCADRTFLETVRVPMRAFCSEDDQIVFPLQEIVQVDIDLPDLGEAFVVDLDTLELTNDPADVQGACLGEAASWNCIATQALVAVETSCSGEPTSRECDVGDVEQNVVALPQVEDGQGTFSGWVVHTPPGWIVDPTEPGEVELTNVLERCVEACLLEYADDPFVDVACSAEGFFEPTLRARGSVGAWDVIPDEHADGSGLFDDEEPGCDLRTSCTAAFDENIGPSRTRRVSPASEPLHRGEEWLITAAGQIQADSTYSTAPAAADVEAVVGYSRCTAGNAASCPFYLGSMELELTEPMTLELECDSQPQVYELTDLVIRLVQPAFGVAEQGTTWSAFPPGGLVLAADGVVNEVPFTTIRAIEEPVYLDAADGQLWFQGLHGFKVDLQVPCNGIMADVAVWWDLANDTVLAGPPALGIDHLPSTIACPDELALTLAWANDPDEDYESLRWVIDGVLLEETWPTIDFTESHEITAILRDSRGATASATKTIVCQ